MGLRARLWAAAAAAFLLGSTGAALPADEGLYPIWWSPKLELDSLDEVEAELDAPFPSGTEVEVTSHSIEPELYFDEVRGEFWLTNLETADNCRSLIELTAAGFDSGEYRLRAALGARCYSLDALSTAQPAKASYLRDSVLDDTAIRYLPAMLGLLGDCSYLKEILEANRRGLAWAPLPDHDPYYRIDRAEARDHNTLVVKGKVVNNTNWVSTIQIYGRGDFNGDGLDDLLVRTDVDEIVNRSPRLFLLTRSGRDQTLRVVWEYGVLPTIYSGCRYGGYDLAIPDEKPFARPE